MINQDVFDGVGATLPLLIAAILVGAGIFGSRLTDQQRRWAQRFVLLPAYYATLAALIGVFLWTANWLAAGAFTVLGGVVAYRHWKGARSLPSEE